MSSSDEEKWEESDDPITSGQLRACCKQKARPRPHFSETEEEQEEEEEDNDSCEGESVSEASESADVGISGFLDEEALEAELSSSEEWEEGSGGSEVEGESSDSDYEGRGLIIEEAEDEEEYQARKRRRARVLSDDGDDDEDDVVSDGEVSTGSKEDGVLCSSGDRGVARAAKRHKACVVSDDTSEQGSWNEEEEEEEEGMSEEGGGESDDAESEDEKEARREEREASLTEEEEEEGEKQPVIGGLFQLAKKTALALCHQEDTSLVHRHATLSSSSPRPPPPLLRDWTEPGVVSAAKCLFVTGDWGAEGARALLAEDDALYGDFEDMETGEREVGEMPGEGKDEDQLRLEKKKRLKTAFDVGYDEGEGPGGGTSHLEELKKEVSEQERRNRAEFESMDEQTRLQYEGVRPGYYVRVELKGERKSNL